MSETTIIANHAKIKAHAERMRDLAAKIEARSFCPEFEQGSGEFVSEMNALASELKNAGSALSRLAMVTAQRFDNASFDFLAADELAAGMYRKGE